MSLLLSPSGLGERRAIAEGGLCGLADSLRSDLAPLLTRELYVPEEKALLSRDGGRCPVHGVLLEFDPWSAHEHRCPFDGERFRGELHDRFWIYWYQLWLAERAVHAALAHALRGDASCGALAARILEAYADRYLRYPNVDNVLGPTRPFFSTYLESIWLLQLCVAVDLLESSSDAHAYRLLGARTRERVIEPSVALIASYDEGTSNRQVWNNAALIAGNQLLGRLDRVEAATYGPSGLVRHLSDALLSDGTWYEGENYHLFAHRGLWYGVVMAERRGSEIPASLVARFHEGFASPFVVALPDFTLPSRRDSQYGISLRQWRFAESCELGLARGSDERLTGALARLYADDVPARDTGRWRSTAEVEHNEAPVRLARADLGWRSLLFARETLPALVPVAPRSTLLEGQGLAILRRSAGRVYAALDYGHSGGGHGHPDRLNVQLVDGHTRWLDDMGTGSYVDPSLHWYRSTLAHNAPLVDGRSQQRVHGRLLAYADSGEAGWVEAAADIADGVKGLRTLVAMPEYVLDMFAWDASRDVVLDLPLHVDAECLDETVRFERSAFEGGRGLEDGFAFVHDGERSAIDAGRVVRMRARADAGVLDLWLTCTCAIELWRCVAPGPPGAAERRFVVMRAAGKSGTIRVVWSTTAGLSVFHGEPRPSVELRDGRRHQHWRDPDGWHVDIEQGDVRTTVDLGGVIETAAGDLDQMGGVTGIRSSDRKVISALTLVRGRTLELELGEAHYRRSEQSWDEADRPSGVVTVRWDNGTIALRIAAHRVDRSFAAPGQINPYDNEHADVNGAGVQLYLSCGADDVSAWTLVPIEGTDDVTTRPIVGWGGAISHTMSARWEKLSDGYQIDVEIDAPHAVRPDGTIWFDVIVNEKPLSRARRRGQLVLSGGAGEFVYLRGDRSDAERLLAIQLRDD
jgi:hypothetical protein